MNKSPNHALQRTAPQQNPKPTHIMKLTLRLILTCALLTLGADHTLAAGEVPKLRKALDELQAAKKASDPLPNLEKAKKLLENANKGDKLGDRSKSGEYVDAAIAELKAGDKAKMEQKINAAIANLHQGKDKTK